MACTFTCDGCGKTAAGEFANGQWFKPSAWFERSDDKGPQTACSRPCIETIAKKTGTTHCVMPV